MNKSISKKTEIQTVYAMMLITVSFFLTQVYPRLFLETEGNLIIALVILGTFLCNVRYGVTTGIILAIFVLVTRFVHIISGFDMYNNLYNAKGGSKHNSLFWLERYVTKLIKDQKRAANNYKLQAEKWSSTKMVEQKDGTKKEQPVYDAIEAQGYAKDVLEEILRRRGRGGFPVTVREIRNFKKLNTNLGNQGFTEISIYDSDPERNNLKKPNYKTAELLKYKTPSGYFDQKTIDNVLKNTS